jgi:cobalamin biosynthesis protein CobD/CbiB
MASDKETLQNWGCIFGVLAIFVCLPMHFTLIFVVLYYSDAPPWAWVVFAINIPVSFAFQIAVKFLERLEKAVN